MIKALFDTNIILDVALKRHPFFEDALQLFSLIDQQIINGNVTASTITDIYYISKREKGHNQSIDFIKALLEVVEVIGVDKKIIVNALDSNLKDFEDVVQVFASEANDIEVIITRKKSDFINTSLRIITPKEFLKNFNPPNHGV